VGEEGLNFRRFIRDVGDYILFRLGSLSLLLTSLFMKFFDLSSERSNSSLNYSGWN
jgi:hypothetical protein